MHENNSENKTIHEEINVAVRIIALIIFVYLFRSVFSLHTPLIHATKADQHINVSPTPTPKPDYTTASGKPPQFVVFAFDGSKDLDMWKSTLSFAEDMKKRGSPVHFTYFVNAIYFIDPAQKDVYEPPHEPKGSSLIGYADSVNDVKERIKEVNQAVQEGHEIGSHAVGHFNGVNWSYDDWMQELGMFDKLMDLHRSDPRFATSTLTLTKKNIVGFRAPVLGINAHAMQALKDAGYRYDTSLIGLPTEWPKKDSAGLWEFPLGTVYIANRRPTISMDYSIFVDQTNASDIARKDTPLWNQLYKEVYDAYMNYFTKNYNGNRAPLSIGHHFTLWNDGLYWQVMKDVARDVCGKPEVKCVTFNELADYLDQLPPETLEALQHSKPIPNQQKADELQSMDIQDE